MPKRVIRVYIDFRMCSNIDQDLVEYDPVWRDPCLFVNLFSRTSIKAFSLNQINMLYPRKSDRPVNIYILIHDVKFLKNQSSIFVQQ